MAGTRDLDALLDEALDSFDDVPAPETRGHGDDISAASASQQPAPGSAAAGTSQPAGSHQLAFDPLAQAPSRRPRGRGAGTAGSGTRSVYSTARSRDLPPPQPAASQRRGDDAGASSSVAWLNEFLESTQTGSSQAGSRGAQTAGSDVWAGLPVPPNVSDMSDDEVNAVMGRLLEQISQVAARGGDTAAAVSDATQPRATAASVPPQLDYSAMLQGLAERTPGAERAAAGDPASEPGDAAATDELSALLRGLAEQTAGREPGSQQLPDDPDAVLQALAASMQGMGLAGGEEDAETGDMDGMVGNIMRQLLSKDVLHQSMKDIGAKYPAWLEAHKETVKPEDLARYRKQLRHIKDICALYERDPDNFGAIYHKMQEMQACGAPPDDIVQELSPGLGFGGLGAGMPQVPGIPSCSVM